MSEPTANSPLRWILIALLIPAFPLCIVHAVKSKFSVPAFGLIPLIISALTAALLLRLPTATEEDEEDDDVESHPPIGAHADEVDQSTAAKAHAIYRKATIPPAVFLLDVILAISAMLVLVYTWITPQHGRWRDRVGLAVLGAYATMPIIASFCIHLYLAAMALWDGLAVQDLYHRLRPDIPAFPWLKHVRHRRAGYTPVATEEADRYRDEPEVADAAASTPQPEAVEVKRKGGKGRGTPAPSEDTTPPWSS